MSSAEPASSFLPGRATHSARPVGDLVAGMAYLVRRLLENTSNESFLSEQARGVPVQELLAALAEIFPPRIRCRFRALFLIFSHLHGPHQFKELIGSFLHQEIHLEPH